MINIDIDMVSYGLEHSIKKMDDYISEIRAIDGDDVVKDYIIENHEQSKKKMQRIIDKINGDEVSETNLVLLSDHELEILIDTLQDRGEA